MFRSSQLALVAISAALYAAAIAATAYVPTPWGVGRFAPGVVIPAFFAVATSPLVAAAGAAIGVFVGDLFTPSTTPLLSLTAGVPANFVGIYLLGWLVSKRQSWRSFVWASVLAITVGNLIAAGLVASYLVFVPVGVDAFAGAWSQLPATQVLGTLFGLALFWVVTMVPFVIPIVPALVRAIRPLEGRANSGIRPPAWATMRLATIVPVSGVVAGILGAVAAVVTVTPLGDALSALVGVPAFWLQALVAIAAVSVVVFGPLSPALGRATPSSARRPTST